LASLGLVPVAVLTLGITAVVWVPLLLFLGGVMLTVWIARRRRQILENRNDYEVKNPGRVDAPWPKSVAEDRLPEP
jgi:hypothetical protein